MRLGASQHWGPPLSGADLAGCPQLIGLGVEGLDKLRNEARITLLQGLTGLLVPGDAGSAPGRPCGRYASARTDSSRPASGRSDGFTRADRRRPEGQITERFASPSTSSARPVLTGFDVRFAGIYAWNASRPTPQPRAGSGRAPDRIHRSHALYCRCRPLRSRYAYRNGCYCRGAASRGQPVLIVICRRPIRRTLADRDGVGRTRVD
jgi:hypothetical protein